MMAALTKDELAFIEWMKESPEREDKGFTILIEKRADRLDAFFDSLIANGFLAPEKNPGPADAGNNAFTIPYWPPLKYLEACAALALKHQDNGFMGKILDVVRGVSLYTDADGKHRDNPTTFWKFAEIVAQLPTSLVLLQDIDLVRIWLSTRFSTNLVTDTLNKGWLSKLLDSDAPEDWSKACRLIEHCTAIKWEGERKGLTERQPATAADDYFLSDMVHEHATVLGAKAGREAVEIFVRRVREVFDGLGTKNMTWLTRPAVEPHEQNHGWESAANAMIDGARDSLLGWVDSDAIQAAGYVADLLRDEAEMVRRISIHIADERWAVMRAIHEEILQPTAFEINHLHELHGLLRRRFQDFDAHEKSLTLAAIRGISIPDRGNETEHLRQYVQKRWLIAIVEKGSLEADEWFARLQHDPTLAGDFEHPDFLSYSEVRSGPGLSPFRPHELVALAHQGNLRGALRSFEEPGTWRGPTMGALVDALEEAVSIDPALFADQLEMFEQEKAAFQYGLLSGFRKAWQAPREQRQPQPWTAIWNKILLFCVKLAEGDELWRPDEEARASISLVPTREWVVQAMADLVVNGNRSNENAYDPSLFGKTWVLLRRILEKAKSLSSMNDEPLDQAINSTRGRAIEALYIWALHACRVQDKEQGSHEEAWNAIAPTIEHELSQCRDGKNFEFSAITGRYFVPLDYMSAHWLRDKINLVFPETDQNFIAATTGALYGNITSALYSVLVRRGVIDRMLQQRSVLKRIDDRIVEWVGLGYLWGEDDLASSRFSALAHESAAKGVSHLAAFFWQLRPQKQQEMSPDHVEKIFRFWEWAASIPQATPNVLSPLSLLACYLTHFDERGLRLLDKVAPFAQDGHWGLFFFEQLDRLADIDAKTAGAVLAKTIDRSLPQFDLHDHLASILRKMEKAGDRDSALRLADRLQRTLPRMADLYRDLRGNRV